MLLLHVWELLYMTISMWQRWWWWFAWLGRKKSWVFCVCLVDRLLALGVASHHVVRKLKKPLEMPMWPNWGLPVMLTHNIDIGTNLISMWVSHFGSRSCNIRSDKISGLQMVTALAHILVVTIVDSPSQNHSTKWPPPSWHIETMRDNNCLLF